MAFKVSDFKAAIGYGVRPNLFKVSFTAGTALSVAEDSTNSVLVKAAQLPGSTIGMIEVPHLGGRRMKVAGDRTFAEWTMTVINDEGYSARKAYSDYQKLIVSADYTTTTVGSRLGTALTTVTVKQLDVDGGSAIRTYTLNNAFITDMSAIDLSYDSTDTISEFTVTWVYDYFTVAAA